MILIDSTTMLTENVYWLREKRSDDTVLEHAYVNINRLGVTVHVYKSPQNNKLPGKLDQ